MALAISILTGAEAVAIEPPPAAASRGNTVLELFTSQGCSSCPPADALLGKYADKPGLVVLSFSIDYWDYLGWHDTLASSANSRRQRDYAQARGDGRVYTPQLVVDGLVEVNGGDDKAIQAAIKSAETRLADDKVPIEMRADGGTLVIDVGAAPPKSDRRDGTIWLVLSEEEVKVSVTRGENRGKLLTYHYPVRDMTPIGMWTGAATTLRLPIKELKTMGGDCLVAVLQQGDAGPILGVAKYEPKEEQHAEQNGKD